MAFSGLPSLDVVAQQLRDESTLHQRRNRSGPQPEHTWLSILNSFRDPVALFDRQLRHVYVNEATALATNIPSERFRGKRMRDLGHPQHICDQIDHNIQAVFEAAEERSIHLLFDGPNGTVRYECRMFPEFDEDDAHVQYVIVISRATNLADSPQP
jgi:PAS domain-containing protein